MGKWVTHYKISERRLQSSETKDLIINSELRRTNS